MDIKIFIVLLCFVRLALADLQVTAEMEKEYREVLSELVKADTSNPPGNEARAVTLLAARLKAAGIDYKTQDFAPGRSNIVARLKGSGTKKPLLLLAHIDVVGTAHQEWSVPPHEVTDKDGFYYGRGVRDDLGMAALNLETLLWLKRNNIALNRDVIAAFTGDEETGGLGIEALLKDHADWVDAAVALNEGGAPIKEKSDGPVTTLNIQMAEKTYQDFTISTKGTTGHSSVPQKNNAIYRLSAALEKLGQYSAAPRFIPITKSYFEQKMPHEKPEVAAALKELMKKGDKISKKTRDILMENPMRASTLSTTCVATMLSGGTKANALPPTAEANVNCRILPDESPESVQKTLAKLINDPEVKISMPDSFGKAEASPLFGEGPDAIKAAGLEVWPQAQVLPSMSTGATDSRYLRMRGIAAYGINPVPTTESDLERMHGIDERVNKAGIPQGMDFMLRVVLKLASEQALH